MPAPSPSPEPVAREIDVQTAHDTVDLPQQYGNWREYAFSDFREDDRHEAPQTGGVAP